MLPIEVRIYPTFEIVANLRLLDTKKTETLVYRVYHDGKLGADLGGSSAQSVILMFIVIMLTAIQFKYIERKVEY